MKEITTNDVIVVFRSREKFYGKLIYWYQFETVRQPLIDSDLIPKRFLRVPDTIYYEYGGTHEQAVKDLTSSGFTRMIKGGEL